ncbi:MAG: response regulator [Deltaproteobacteria bacterium]|jgi:putative two-component system response regulator|nr:response regulator [Deltaproteobacteria bacterium]
MPKRILVVDDELASLKQVSVQLSSHYDLALAKSGYMALRICEQERPDLILLDVEMKEMNGFDVIARIRQNPALERIPVIFLTGHRSAEVEIKALLSGAMDFITKPVNKDILFHRIEMHLKYSAYQSYLDSAVKELENSIVLSFAELIECRDKNTGGHLLRTSRYMEILSRELLQAGLFTDELTPHEVDMMIRGVLFHDIGKIGISDAYLNKSGTLSPQEYDEVKKHTLIGARIVESIYQRMPAQEYMKYAAMIAEGHHERYDGTGYPHGLSGDKIPLCCRIAAVVNVYDGCRTERPHRPVLTHEEACRIIMKGAGAEFDPIIVSVFGAISGKFAEVNLDMRPLAQV